MRCLNTIKIKFCSKASSMCQTLMIISLNFILLLKIVTSGIVHPYGPRPIVLSSSNAGRYSDYNFTMMLDTSLPASSAITITFPYNQYTNYLGLGLNPLVYFPYPNIIPIVSLLISGQSITLPIGPMPANQSFIITVCGIQNPLKTGGTGNFMVFSLFLQL